MMAKEGAKVAAIGRNVEALEELSKAGLIAVQADLARPGACEKAVAEAVAALGGLTTLANCAGALETGAVGGNEPGKTVEVLQTNLGPNTMALYEMMEYPVVIINWVQYLGPPGPFCSWLK